MHEMFNYTVYKYKGMAQKYAKGKTHKKKSFLLVEPQRSGFFLVVHGVSPLGVRPQNKLLIFFPERLGQEVALSASKF